MDGHGSWEILSNWDHKKDDAPAPPQKNHLTDDMTFVYVEFEDEFKEIHDNGVEIVVVSNLGACIELAFSMYETYKVTDLKKNDIIAAVSLALTMNCDTNAKLSILLW